MHPLTFKERATSRNSRIIIEGRVQGERGRMNECKRKGEVAFSTVTEVDSIPRKRTHLPPFPHLASPPRSPSSNASRFYTFIFHRFPPSTSQRNPQELLFLLSRSINVTSLWTSMGRSQPLFERGSKRFNHEDYRTKDSLREVQCRD